MKTLPIILLASALVGIFVITYAWMIAHPEPRKQPKTELSKLRDSLSEERKMREWYQQRFERDSKK